MKGFVRQYAATHEDFATVLVEKYWKPERGNYKEQVEACFAHVGMLGKRFGPPQLDWRKIEQDLGPMMRKAKSMKKKLMDLMPVEPFHGESLAIVREPNELESSLM